MGATGYHSLRRNGVGGPAELDYGRIASKLVGPREWVQTRYYIGALPQAWSPGAYAEQRRFLSRLMGSEHRIQVLLGRLEPRPERNPLADRLRSWVAETAGEVSPTVAATLTSMADQHGSVMTLREKAVDIMLAVDMVRLSQQDAYDAAYLLSADGDFTPAVEAVRASGRNVYAASPDLGFALKKSVNTYIHLKREWFADCYRAQRP